VTVEPGGGARALAFSLNTPRSPAAERVQESGGDVAGNVNLVDNDEGWRKRYRAHDEGGEKKGKEGGGKEGEGKEEGEATAEGYRWWAEGEGREERMEEQTQERQQLEQRDEQEGEGAGGRELVRAEAGGAAAAADGGPGAQAEATGTGVRAQIVKSPVE
jgi:hypothetical protein